MTKTAAELLLMPLLRTLRRPRGEAEWTQMIAAIATSDAGFAAQLAAALVDGAPNESVRATINGPPSEVRCMAEVSLRDRDGTDLGRVDLRFADDVGDFELLVEIKLGSGYGTDQLDRYRRALDASAAKRKGLIAITSLRAQIGEETVIGHPNWLGSVRWAEIFDRVRAIEHCEPVMTASWRASLDLLREQGDFGRSCPVAWCGTRSDGKFA